MGVGGEVAYWLTSTCILIQYQRVLDLVCSLALLSTLWYLVVVIDRQGYGCNKLQNAKGYFVIDRQAYGYFVFWGGIL